MTDETRNQIGRDSKEYASTHLGDNGTYYDKETAFRAGAERQHPISFEKGRKSAIDAFNKIVSRNYDMACKHKDHGATNVALNNIREELEALKNENEVKG
jgi:hypothetical protein